MRLTEKEQKEHERLRKKLFRSPQKMTRREVQRAHELLRKKNSD